MAQKTVRDRIDILAGAIRSEVRARGLGDYKTMDSTRLNRVAEYFCHKCPDTVAAQFHMVATDRQWTRVVNMVHRSR